MRKRWWAVAFGAVAVKIWALASWMLQPDPGAHAASAAPAPASAAPAPAAPAPPPGAPPPPPESEGAADACRPLLVALHKERAALETRARALAARERAVGGLEHEARAKLERALAVSREARAAVERALRTKEALRLKGVAKMAKLLSAMKPPEAAALLGRIRVSLAVAALSAMDEARAGKILGLLAPERAAVVGEALLFAPRRKEDTARAPNR